MTAPFVLLGVCATNNRYQLQKRVVSVKQLEMRLESLQHSGLDAFDASKYWDVADLREWIVSIGGVEKVIAGRVADEGMEAFLQCATPAAFCDDLGLTADDANVLWTARQRRVRSCQVSF